MNTNRTPIGRVKITEEHEAALIAAILNADGPVARAELRALLPRGLRNRVGLKQQSKEVLRGGNGGHNDVSEKLGEKLGEKLRQWEERGWIIRTPSHVEAVEHAALQARLAELQELQPKRTIADIEREIVERRQANP
jgi:hypothetical protein